MDLTDLDFAHPEAAVAQRPAPVRESARLLRLGAAGGLAHLGVTDLPSQLAPGTVVVLNDSSVRRARLFGRKESGGRVEVLLLERLAPQRWTALVKASHAPTPGSVLVLGETDRVTVTGRPGGLFELVAETDLDALSERCGLPPLPPYIRREADAEDVVRYQTTFARRGPDAAGGVSSAAPTAGLHLTPALLQRMQDGGASVVSLRLGVGAGTFRPVESPRVEDHRMHEEAFEIPEETARTVNAALREGRPILAVGTTTVRALESAATPGGRLRALRARTGLFLLPGSRFRIVSRLLTNFHQPRSTLLALVQAFAGRELVDAAYASAIAAGYRLFSYGDAMLCERAP